MVDALGLGDVRAHATPQHPDRRLVTAGTAVNALVRHGRGVVHPPRARVPPGVPPQPTARRLASGLAATPLQDEAWGRAVDRLEAHGVTERCRLLAATAARRLGLPPPVAPRERPRVPVEGREHRAAAPDAPVMPRTRGDRGAHRPARHHVRRDVSVEPHAGLPVVLTPRRGQRRAGSHGGHVGRQPMVPWPTPSGLPSLVAAGALSSAAPRQQRAATRRPWLTRVPAPWRAAPAARAPAEPPTRGPVRAGERAHGCPSTDGEVAPRWRRSSAAARHPQAPPPVATPLRPPRAPAVGACQPLCRTACAGAPAAPPALATCAPGGPRTSLHQGRRHPTPRARTRGRPGHSVPPDPVRDPRDGALASAVARREAWVAQPRCGRWATQARDDPPGSPAAWLTGDPGQQPAARGRRFRTDPPCVAASRARPTPERLRALGRVMTVGWCLEAAWEDRSRPALTAHEAPCPPHTGASGHHPPARGVWHAVVGMHRRLSPGPWPPVVHLTAEHPPRLQRRGKPSVRWYADICTHMRGAMRTVRRWDCRPPRCQQPSQVPPWGRGLVVRLRRLPHGWRAEFEGCDRHHPKPIRAMARRL